MINSCDTWSTGFHGNDQCLSYMINSLSYQWSTVVINDQQSFMAMINVYLTWSTVFHPMIDVDHAWTVMNDIVHKAMNNANCIYTLTFTFLLSSSPTSGERRGGGKAALSQLPPFLGFEQKYFNREFLEHWKIMCQFAEAVVSTSEEKKAPPYMERLQKEHCKWKNKQ